MSDASKRKTWFDRNEQAEQLEAAGDIRGALKLYEQNAEEGCDVAYTYERMAALYRGQEQYDKEIGALEKAIEIEGKRGPTAQMIRLQKRLETTKEIRSREGGRPVLGDREGEEGTTRRKAVKKKEKKGCLSVVAALVGSSALLVALLRLV